MLNKNLHYKTSALVTFLNNLKYEKNGKNMITLRNLGRNF